MLSAATLRKRLSEAHARSADLQGEVLGIQNELALARSLAEAERFARSRAVDERDRAQAAVGEARGRREAVVSWSVGNASFRFSGPADVAEKLGEYGKSTVERFAAEGAIEADRARNGGLR